VIPRLDEESLLDEIVHYSALTFSARGPFGPWPIVNVTA
jgi:hypothetical protein